MNAQLPNKNTAKTGTLISSSLIWNDKAAPAMKTAIRGRVMRSHRRRPMVSILLIAGSAKMKLIAPRKGSLVPTMYLKGY